MTYEEKKDILLGYGEYEAKIKYCKMSIEQYKEAKTQAGTQKLSAVTVASGNNSDLSEYISKLEDLSNNLISMMLRSIQYKEALISWIDTLDNEREKLTLKYKYILHMPISWIAEEMEPEVLSDKTVRRTIKSGITNLPDIDKKIFQCP